MKVHRMNVAWASSHALRKARCSAVMFAIVLCMVTVPGLAAAQEPSSYANAYAELKAKAHEQGAQDGGHAGLQGFYDAHFAAVIAGSTLSRLPPKDLIAIFQAAYYMAFFTPDDAHLRDMQKAFDALEQRHLAGTTEATHMYEAYFQARHFDDMARFRAAHPTAPLEAPTRLASKASPFGSHRMLKVLDAGTVEAQRVDLSKGAHIVVIGNPGCHFTQWAVEAIEHDPALGAVFNGHAVWLSPADGNIDLAPFAAWNKAHPATRIDLVGTEAGWPEVGAWQTPTFLFFKDGRVVDRVIGWPKEGSAAAVEAGWAKANGKA